MQYINTWYQGFKPWIGGLIVLVAIAVSGQAKLAESDALPDLSTFQLQGELPDPRGKVVLLDFWASWCAPCKASFPAMDKIYREFKDRGFEIVAVSVDARAKEYETFASKSAVSFPLLWDAQKKLVERADIEVMPTSFLVDKKGIIRAIHKGYLGKKTVDAYREEIQSLLKE